MFRQHRRARNPGSRLAAFLASPALAVLFGLACSPSATPTPTLAPTSTAAAALASPPVPAATSTSNIPQAAPPSATTSPAPAAPGRTRFAILDGTSEARFVARELLAANTIQNDAVGTTRNVSGAVIVESDGQIGSSSRVSVDLADLKSDRAQRDGFIKRTTLQTSEFPTAEFTPLRAEGLPTPLPPSGSLTFALEGDLTVRGVTRPTRWDILATLSPDSATGTATTVVRLETFGMQTPRVPVVASIEPDIRLEIDFAATRGT